MNQFTKQLFQPIKSHNQKLHKFVCGVVGPVIKIAMIYCKYKFNKSIIDSLKNCKCLFGV